MIKLHDFTIDKVSRLVTEQEIQFLNLTGRQAYYSQEFYGEGAIVAVVDTGVSPHRELMGRLLNGRSFVDYTSRTIDDNGHGTHVAGTVAGKNVGVAPRANILPVKVLDSEGNGSLDNLIAGLNWVNEYTTREGKKVNSVNLSLSVDDITDEEKESLHTAIKALVENDIAVIVAAGNTSKEEIRYPAAYDEVICVGAVDISGKRAMFSTMGDHVDVCQVGVDVVSAWYKGGYAVMSGTSMSTPIVSGVGALLVNKHYQIFSEQITEDYLWRSIKLNTKDLGIPGADREYGTGFSTLQPLQVNMLMKNNSPYFKVNERVYKLDYDLVATSDKFLMPGNYVSEATGAYIEYLDDEMVKFSF